MTEAEISTRGGRLEAAHIFPYSEYPEKRFDLGNGRAACKFPKRDHPMGLGCGYGCHYAMSAMPVLHPEELEPAGTTYLVQLPKPSSFQWLARLRLGRWQRRFVREAQRGGTGNVVLDRRVWDSFPIPEDPF